MNLVLQREPSSDKSTIGALLIDGARFCWTLEDVVRENKITGRTAIPAGLYEVLITYSNRFQKPLPLLIDVPNYSGVRIHAGNTDADTDGCILIGFLRQKDFIGKSQLAMSMFMPRLQEALDMGKVFIDVRNP